MQTNRSNNKLRPVVFMNTKEVQKNTKENPILTSLHKILVIFLFLGLHLLGQHSWSVDELKDTHIGRIACTEKLHTQLHAHAIWQKIACACNLQGMQSYQDGCLSTRLDFSNACAYKLTLTAAFLNNIL